MLPTPCRHSRRLCKEEVDSAFANALFALPTPHLMPPLPVAWHGGTSVTPADASNTRCERRGCKQLIACIM